MTSAFIIEVNSQLQPDPNEETAALLRVLIYKTDSTTFGGDIPTIPPPWTGPPRMIVQVQAILYASFAASLFSALLAMLGKQWLNRYMSTDMRGTAIERSQNRQQKLNGIVTWYFDYVMESLPLMLQAALLLLGCALSRYLWEMNTTVGSVILGFTSLGVLFYLFIVAAGSVSASCPYQTPGSRIIRSTASALISATPAVVSAFVYAFKGSVIRCVRCVLRCIFVPINWKDIGDFLWSVVHDLSLALMSGVAHLGAGSTLDQQTTLLDLHCISWILQTSLDKDHHLSAMEHLATVVALPDFDPSLIMGCLGALVSCVKVTDGTVVVTEELEKLATLSAICFLYIFTHLSAMGPPGVLAEVCQKYVRLFPYDINFNGLPFCYTFGAIHSALYQGWRSESFQARIVRLQAQSNYYKPSNLEYATLICLIINLAQSEYQRKKEVSDWILCIVLHTPSMDPLPSTLVIVNHLSIIAICLDCDISEIRNMALDKRYAHPW